MDVETAVTATRIMAGQMTEVSACGVLDRRTDAGSLMINCTTHGFFGLITHVCSGLTRPFFFGNSRENKSRFGKMTRGEVKTEIYRFPYFCPVLKRSCTHLV